MLKLRKVFLLGLVVAALGLLVVSCVEPTDFYSVTITSGDEGTGVGGAAARPGSSGAGTTYEEGDIVTVKAGTAPTGKKFYEWTSSPTVTFNDPKSSTASFTMPAKDVEVTAWFITDVLPLEPMVRYTWEQVQEPNIQSIAASKDDVYSWYEDVFLAGDYIEDDATDIPLFDGSPDIPNNIYSRTLHSENGSPHKSVYFDISADHYTAVCTVDDPAFDNIADIVANYTIEIEGKKAFFEIAFDVGTFLAGEDDVGWIGDKYDNPDTVPRLEKTPAKKMVKKLQKGNVTYYVLHRARK